MRGALLCLILFGCGGDNQSRCERANAKINVELEACGLPTVSDANACFAYAELNESNCSDFFACEADRYSCEEGQLLQSLDSCPACE